MKYDDTGPVRVNETKSLLVMVALLGMVGAGVGVAVYLNRPKPAAAVETQKATEVAVSSRPAAGVGPAASSPASGPGGGGSGMTRRDGVRRLDTGVTYVRVSPAVVTLTRREGSTRVSMRDARITDEMLSFNNAAVRAMGDATYGAEQLGLSKEQVEKFKQLKLGYNALAAEDVKALRALYDKAEKATGAEREAADAELVAYVKDMTSAERVEAFKGKIAQVMEILTAEQEAAIRSLYNAQRAATRPAASAPSGGAGTEAASAPATSAPATRRRAVLQEGSP